MRSPGLGLKNRDACEAIMICEVSKTCRRLLVRRDVEIGNQSDETTEGWEDHRARGIRGKASGPAPGHLQQVYPSTSTLAGSSRTLVALGFTSLIGPKGIWQTSLTIEVREISSGSGRLLLSHPEDVPRPALVPNGPRVNAPRENLGRAYPSVVPEPLSCERTPRPESTSSLCSIVRSKYNIWNVRCTQCG